MAQFQCTQCDYDAHFVEFRTGTHEEIDDETGEVDEVDDLECPQCGSESVIEL
jgi:Zn finger protein HypA/HybF involved in hydrogenase expression